MLILTRKPNQAIRLRLDGVDVWITYCGNHHDRPEEACIGVEAPGAVRITRVELLDESERPCGKRRYRTRDLALAAIAKLRAKGRARERPGVELRPYVCDQCAGAWHNGHRRVEPPGVAGA